MIKSWKIDVTRALGLAALVLFVVLSSSHAQVPDVSSYYTMAEAAQRDKYDDLVNMLQAGKTPDMTDDSGETPLGYAAQSGSLRMVQALLYYKAPVDRHDQFGNTPLHWAAQRGSLDVMQALIGANATVDAQNKQGMTPLMMAANRSQLQAVRLLVKAGADPHKQDFTGRDALGWAEGKPNVLQLLRGAP